MFLELADVAEKRRVWRLPKTTAPQGYLWKRRDTFPVVGHKNDKTLR